MLNKISLKSKVKKQNSAANKHLVKKMYEKYDLVHEMNKLIKENYAAKIEKLRGDFKNYPQDFDLLYPIMKLSDPDLEIENTKKKNTLINEIFREIKKRYSFFYFLSFYHINDNILMKLIPFLTYENYSAGNYIYKENDLSTKFYFIIKGIISFRKKEIVVIDDTNSKIVEAEKFILGEEKYFGETDLIYDRRKRYSAYCTTECHFLTVKKEIFKKLIEDKIARVETEKKIFLISFFNTYADIPSVKLEKFIFNNVQTLFFKRNEVIYREGEDNICLYIIYCGEANLIKNINEGEFSYIPNFNESIKYISKKAGKMNYPVIINSNVQKIEEEKNSEMMKLDILLNKSKYSIVGNLVKGSIGGLEITTGIRKLKYSLISNSEFTCVLKIDLRNIDDYLNMLMINLLPFFIKLERNINRRINNIKLIDETILPLSCKKLKKSKSTRQFQKEEEENDKVYKKHIQNINDNFQLNRGGFIKVNEYNFKLYQQKTYFQKMLKNNQKKNFKIKEILKNLEKEEKLNLKFTEFKMNKYISSPQKSKTIDEYITDKKLKRPESCFFTCSTKKNNNLKFHDLKLNGIDLNSKKDYYSPNKENILSKNNNLFKITKRALKIIKNNNKKKKKLTWADFKTEVKFDKKENIKKNFSNLDDIIAKIKLKKEKAKSKNKAKNALLYIKKALSIDDNYTKKVFIYRSPKSNTKTKEIFYSTPNNNNILNVNNYKNKYNKTKEDKMVSSFDINEKDLKIQNTKISKKLMFYNTGKFDIPLLSDIS